MRTLAIALVLASPLLAQRVSFGVRGGLPLTAPLEDGAHEPGNYMMGALVEVHLFSRASLGADFLFRHAETAISAAGAQRVAAWQWQVPVTFVYRFPAPGSPFLRGGIALNRIFDIHGATECGHGPFGERFYCTANNAAIELRHKGTYGFVAGCGLRFKLKRISLEPEVRLTRWVDRNFGTRESAARSNLNEAAILLGVRY